MAKIILERWKEGLLKVSLTKLQMDILGTSLKVAKGNVDALLDGKTIILENEDELIAQSFYEQAIKIGVICKLSRS